LRDISLLVCLWLCLGLVCLGVPLLYFFYICRYADKTWNLKTDNHFQPSVSIIVPTYNEGQVIRYKLQNLVELNYPKDLIQVVIVDSASTDGTMREIESFKENNSNLDIVAIRENKRTGKSSALNLALKHSRGEIVIVSDADCFWPSDILTLSVPYLADETVAAIAGKEKILNPRQSWVTETESLYRDTMFKIQLGESKLRSTVQFEGGFGAYKRRLLNQFDVETGSDDSGTALNLVQTGFRTIVLPQATFYTFFPPTWKGKMTIKVRRAKQFMRIWTKCFILFAKGKLVLPKRIFFPQAFLLLINPILCMAFALTSILLIGQFPWFALLPIILVIIPKTRVYLVEFLQNNLVALLALSETLGGKRSLVWTKAEDSRENFDVDVLKRNGLIK